MPLMNIYYTDNFQEEKELMGEIQTLHSDLSVILGANVQNFKSFLFPSQYYVLGEDCSLEKSYIRIELKMLPGRTDEVKMVASELIFKRISDFIRIKNIKESIELSVNIYEILGNYTTKRIEF